MPVTRDVAANLADAGWDVLVLEARLDPGGAGRSAELIPGNPGISEPTIVKPELSASCRIGM